MPKKLKLKRSLSLSETSLDGLNVSTSKKGTAFLRSTMPSEGQRRMEQRNYSTVKLTIDILIRVCLVIIFIKLESKAAFKRVIHVEEMWLYRYPPTKDYIPTLYLLLAVVLCPLFITMLNFLFTRDKHDFIQSTHAWTLALGLTGLITSVLKITVGRPRPDYFYRCYPDGTMVGNITVDGIYDNCTGIARIINEGRKSFPSGHSSFAFSSFGFIACYLSGKLNVFNEKGRGQNWRLCTVLTPLIIASLVAISRTCDYHHHWEDVFVGSIIGFFINYCCYRQYYPSIFSRNCHRPFPKRISNYVNIGSCNAGNLNDDSDFLLDSGGSDEHRPLIDTGKDNKWT